MGTNVISEGPQRMMYFMQNRPFGFRNQKEKQIMSYMRISKGC